MPPAKKRKTAAKAKGAKKDHVVTARASPPPPADNEPEPANDAPPAPEPSNDAHATITEEHAAPTETPEPAPALPEAPTATAPSPDLPTEPSSSSSSTTTTTTTTAPTTKMSDRLAKLTALRNRSKASSAANLSAAQKEAHRLKHDPAELSTLQRKSDVAAYKLRRAEIEDAGGDFWRKRAWDHTVDEDEAWHAREAEKAAHRDNNVFQDFGAEAGKVYDRQVRNLGAPDLERYLKDKTAAIEQAAARGTLEIVETEDGEMVAVDRDGTFYGGGGGGRDLISSFSESKPDKKAVDRLVGEMKKAEEVAAKKRRERLARNGDDGDVTYINDKNKQFNQKLSRFYNKYTADIRDSFERGTMI